MNKLGFVFLISLIISCGYIRKSTSLFKDKIIVYSGGRQDSDTNYSDNNYYVAYYNDSVRKIGYAWNFIPQDYSEFDTLVRGDELLIKSGTTDNPVRSELPFRFVQQGKLIFKEFKINSKHYREKIYSLKKNDSISIVE